MNDHEARFHLNDLANVLAKLSAQIDEEYQAALDTPTTDLSRAQQEQLMGRILALGAVRTWMLSAQSADLDEQTEVARRSNRIQEQCFKLSKIYEDFSAFLTTTLSQMQKEQSELFQGMYIVMVQGWPLLHQIGSASSEEEFALAEHILDDAERIHQRLKAEILTAPYFKGTVQ